MKILVDTNILFSAILNENSRVAKVLKHINENHEIYFAEQNIVEIQEIIKRKMPTKKRAMMRLFREMSYKVVFAKDEKIDIRDVKDKPILLAAIQNNLDYIIAGDKDFLVLDLKRPRCITVDEYCKLEKVVLQ